MNSRISPRERGLIKGAIRRAFSRSDLRRQVVNDNITDHTDASRPRVKKWGVCTECKTPTPKSYLIVDHIVPVIPVDKSFEEMTLDEVVDRMWCSPDNLQVLCDTCHLQKTKDENKIRKSNKKEKKNERCKDVKKSAKTATTRSSHKRASNRNGKTNRGTSEQKTGRNRKKT